MGSAAVEIAVARGATVIATASERNHAYLASLGAAPTTYGPGLAERVARLAPNGVDVALDTAASGSLADLVAIVGEPGRVSTVADHAGAASLGVHLANAENNPEYLAEAAELGREGRYTPQIERTFPFAEIADAHTYVERGHVRGKVTIAL